MAIACHGKTSLQMRAASVCSQRERNALLDILAKNIDTEIGKRWNFKDIATIDEYCGQGPSDNL